MTPSRKGRTSSIDSGARPISSFALRPTARISREARWVRTATAEGSSMMMPRPATCTSVFAVPRSIAMSSENALVTANCIVCP